MQPFCSLDIVSSSVMIVMTDSELLSVLSISYSYSFPLLLSPPPELFVVLVLQVSSYLKFYPVAGGIDIFIALLYDQQHKKKFPVHATIQHSFSPSSVQAPAGYQSCPLLGTKFLWLFLKLDNCVLFCFFFSPGAKCHCVTVGQRILQRNHLEFCFRTVSADTKNGTSHLNNEKMN